MLERKTLVHKSPAMSDEGFFLEIDKTGGWPVGYNYVAFFHGMEPEERTCAFTLKPVHTGWWTTVASADDYYWWKLSAEAKQKAVQQARKLLLSGLQKTEVVL